MRRAGVAGLCAILGLAAGGRAAASSGDWPQWGKDPGHESQSGTLAQPLSAILADVVADPFTTQEAAETGGDLLLHYAVALTDGTGVYLEFKSGAYVSCRPPGSGQPPPCGSAAWNGQIWGVEKFQWSAGKLARVWTFSSDWKPEPDAGGLSGWEPVFQPVLAGGFVFVPGAGGSVYELSADTGSVIANIRPFGSPDANLFVAGGLAADSNGRVYYNAIRLDPADPWGADVAGAWLVRVAPDGSFATTPFAALVPDAPAASAACETSFSATQLPWPPSPSAVVPTSSCGSQRPGLNVVPAIAADGTIYTVSRAHRNSGYAYLVAVRSDMAPAWAATLRGLLDDGCEVILPPSGTPGGCRAGSTRGVDPGTNNRPAARVLDLSTSSPVVLPDGSILFGTYASYNYRRGHLLQFDASGNALASYDFGWDITPAVFSHGNTYSIVLKDNHYDVGSYCGNPQLCPAEAGHYDIVSLDPHLQPEWTWTNDNTQSCQRQPDGGVSCVSDHPDGFEWCVNQPAVDVAGVVYANSEDGFLYAIAPGGTLRQRIFLNLAIGAAYTPVSISAAGVVYCQNDGHLFAIGNPARVLSPPPRLRQPRGVGPR